MEVKNSVKPNEEQMAGFLSPVPEAPIYMVNLLKFKEKAEYADGRVANLSGEEAYGIYTDAVSKLLKKYGGMVMFSAHVERLMLGEVEELWDRMAIAMYPSRQAMFAMMQDPAMPAISEHRAAGLVGQLNIETVGAQGNLTP